ncbi:MAG: (2Fe-2S)-binding protein [Treponema sp.]|jgi:NADH-quinone oxidoreductase subunit G|nr:(2Fe-2S)-binding protein [Treponema sp.]
MKNSEYMIIDGKPVAINGEASILDLIRTVGIEFPTFCHNLELPVYGHCRMCMVETREGVVEFACSTPPRPGMNIKTNTEALQRYRRVLLKLVLANPVPDRLQELAAWLSPAGLKPVTGGGDEEAKRPLPEARDD